MLYSYVVGIKVTAIDYVTFNEVSTIQVVLYIQSIEPLSISEISGFTVYIRVKDVATVKDLIKELLIKGIIKVKSSESVKVLDITVCRADVINVGGVDIPLVCEGSIIMPEYKNRRNDGFKKLRDLAYEVCLDYGM